MTDMQLRIGNEQDFINWRQSIDGPGAQHNRLTLTRFWTQAKARKLLLLIRRVGPRHCQICQIPPQELIANKILPRFQLGSIFIAGFPDKTYFIFGTDENLKICEKRSQSAANQNSDDARKIYTRPVIKQQEPTPTKKRRGRPPKNGYQSQI